MLSAELEAEVRALNYLVTVLLRRIDDNDEQWCRDLLNTLKADRRMEHRPHRVKAFDYAIGMVERATGITSAET
jgi:hypothetical protein